MLLLLNVAAMCVLDSIWNLFECRKEMCGIKCEDADDDETSGQLIQKKKTQVGESRVCAFGAYAQ